jgi:hypothetical protein
MIHRIFQVLVLTSAVLLGPQVWAQVTALEKVALRDLPRRLVQLTPAEDHVVEIFHIEGTAPTSDLAPTLAALREQGFEIQGTLLKADDFDRKKEELLAETVSEEKLGFLLNSEGVKEAKKPGGRIRRRIQEMKQKIFGNREGITFFRHFKKLFRPDRDQMVATAEALVIANSVLYLSLADLQNKVPHGTHEILPMALLSGWIMGYILNLKQIASFKGQVPTVEFNPQAAPGKQIQLGSNNGFVFLSTLVQEVIFNTVLTLAIFDPRDLNLPIVLNAIANVPISTFARTPFETKISELVAQAKEAETRGDRDEAARLNKKAVTIERVSSNYIIPAFKLLSLLAPAFLMNNGSSLSDSPAALVSWIGLAAIGTVGAVMKAVKMRYTSSPSEESCEQLLRIRPREDAELLQEGAFSVR